MCVLESRSARSRACTIALRADRVHVLAHDQWRVRVADVRGVELHAQLAAVLLIFPGCRRAHVCARAAAGPDCRGLAFLRLYMRARGAGAMSWAGAGACAGGCWCAPQAAGAVYQSALHPDTAEACAYELGVDNCAWCDCEDGKYGPQTHTVNRGSYKVVANVPDGSKVCMLVHGDPDITQELEVMKKLRDQMQIACVPAVMEKTKELGLSDVEDWLEKIDQHTGVNRKIISTLKTLRGEKQRKMQMTNKVTCTKSELESLTNKLQQAQTNTVHDDELIDTLRSQIQYKKQFLRQLENKQIEDETWYIEEQDVGIDLHNMIRHQSARTDGDYFTTCCNLLSLLHDVHTMIGDKNKIFHCDVKTPNVTGRLEYNKATQEYGLRFYVVDWGFVQQLDSHTELPNCLPMFFYDSQLSVDRTPQIPDEFAACFMCFHACTADHTKTVQDHLTHISEATLHQMWKRVEEYAMFERFACTDKEKEAIWQSTQCFLAQCRTNEWYSELSELRAKQDKIRAEAFMRFMLDYFMHTYNITTQQQALVNMMQRVDCWAYAHTFLEFWPSLLHVHRAQPTYVTPKQQRLHDFIMQQLKTWVLSKSSFSALGSVIVQCAQEFRMYLSESLKGMQRTRLDADDYYHTLSNVLHFLQVIAQKADAGDSSLFTGLKDDQLLVYKCGILNTEQAGLGFFMHPHARMPTGIRMQDGMHAKCALKYNLTQYFDIDNFDAIDTHQTPPDFYMIWVVVSIFMSLGEFEWKKFMTYDDLQLALQLFDQATLDVIPIKDVETFRRVWTPVRDACFDVYSTFMNAAHCEQGTIEGIKNFLCKTTGDIAWNSVLRQCNEIKGYKKFEIIPFVCTRFAQQVYFKKAKSQHKSECDPMVQRLHVWRCSSNLHKFFSDKLETAAPDADVQEYLTNVCYNVFAPRQALAECIEQLKTKLKSDTQTTDALGVTSQCDTLSTCLHMYTFLSEVFSMMDAKDAYFHGDLHGNNITCKLEENALTGENGIKFCVPDWGEAQQNDASTTEFTAIQNEYQLLNFQANSANTKPPEFTMFAMLIMFLAMKCDQGRLDISIQRLDQLSLPEAEAYFRQFKQVYVHSFMQEFSKNYTKYISESDVHTLWEKVKYTFKQMLEQYHLTAIIISLKSCFATQNDTTKNERFCSVLSHVLLTAFEARRYNDSGKLEHIWKPDSSSYTPERALMQRMQGWALSCNIGEYWYANILDAKTHYEPAWDIWQKILVPMRIGERDWFAKVRHEIELKVTAVKFAGGLLEGEQSVSRRSEREPACMKPTYATRAVYQSELHPDTAEACAFALDTDATCEWCDQGRPRKHHIEGGTYKAVADTESGDVVHMLYRDTEANQKEFEMMRSLRNQHNITCVPAVQLYAHEQNIQHTMLQRYKAWFANEELSEIENTKPRSSRQKWVKQLLSRDSLRYATEENVGLDLSNPPPANYDLETTAYNMIMFLEELRVLMSPRLGCFHCDVNATNMTCKLALDSVSHKTGLKFYVIDWGFCVKFGEGRTMFEPLKSFSDLRDLKNGRPSQVPPELAMVSLCILLYLHGDENSFAVFCETLRKKTMQQAVQELTTLASLAREKGRRPSDWDNIHYSRFYTMQDDYKAYVNEAHLNQIWTLVIMSLDDMKTSTDYSKKIENVHWLWNTSQNFTWINYYFAEIVATTMCQMFALARWATVPDINTELALLQRMDIWAYSCSLGKFWHDHILRANKESLLCRWISNALMQVRCEYNDPWSALCMHLRALRTQSGLFSNHLEGFFSDLENERHYFLCDINLLRNYDVVKTFNSFLCGQRGNTDNATKRFISTLQLWLRDYISVELADVEDLPSYNALRDAAKTASIAKKQKTGKARRCAAVVGGANH